MTVLREVKPDAKSIRRYECVCDCGAKVTLRSNHFYPTRRYCTRSCPFLRLARSANLEGRIFDRWTVLRRSNVSHKSGWVMWVCQCRCGTVRQIAGAQLASGSSRSCGCLAKDARATGRTAEEELAIRRLRSRLSNRKNPARVKANKIKYETKRDAATPRWLSQEHWGQMNAIYEKARAMTVKTGIRHEVDHIVPINGKEVSGLHVPWNLQILTQVENVSKSNRYAELLGD